MFDELNTIPAKDALREFVLQDNFPCVGARSAAAKDQIEFFDAGSIASDGHDMAIVSALQRFAVETPPDAMYLSFVVTFNDATTPGESWFEDKLWQRLQAFHDIDVKTHSWDPTVSRDASAADFSMSIGGKAFYVVGLHPSAARLGRQFQRPAMVFNLHKQFENLRASGAYGKFRQTILDRDLKLNGSQNPMLAQHGESSEAVQYSGRQVDEAWKCPFHAKPASKGSI